MRLRHDKPVKRSGIVGYRYADGRCCCVDCDVYPPNTTDVHQHQAQPDQRCIHCGTPLTEVVPLGE